MVSGPRGQGEREPRPNALDNYYGWNSSMGRDVRVDPSLPPQFQYRDQGRTVVSGNEPAFTDMGRNYNWAAPSSGTPNFGGPTQRRGGTYSHELGHTGGYEFNPRPNLKGRFQEPMPVRFPQSGPAGAPVEGPWNREYDTPMMGGLGGLQEQETAGLWQDIKRILNRTKNPGPLIDQWTDHWNQTADASGIGSTDEYQMAELTQDQMNMMGNPLNTPDFGVSKEDLFDRVKGMEDKGFFGWGAQEPTTQEEYDDYYNKLLQGEVGNWVT